MPLILFFLLKYGFWLLVLIWYIKHKRSTPTTPSDDLLARYEKVLNPEPHVQIIDRTEWFKLQELQEALMQRGWDWNWLQDICNNPLNPNLIELFHETYNFGNFQARFFPGLYMQLVNYWPAAIRVEHVIFLPMLGIFVSLLIYILFISHLQKNFTLMPVATILVGNVLILKNFKLPFLFCFTDLLILPITVKIAILLNVLLFLFTIVYLYGYKKSNKSLEILYIILFFLLAVQTIFYSQDLVLIYLALELQAFCLYTMAGLSRDSLLSTEAALKYFILGALASTLFIFGSALIYLTLGTTNLLYIEQNFLTYIQSDWIFSLAVFLLFTGLLAKVAWSHFICGS